MNVARIALLALACAAPLAASAQWMWLDKDGHKVFSDKSPPPEITPEHILKAPKGVALAPAPATEAAAPAAAPAPLAGKDKALEERRKQLAAADAEKKKADDEKVAAARLENCNRARQAKVTLTSGPRIARTDSNGERSYMTDEERAAELRTMEQVIARDCVQ
jgi:hypothetical protein